MISIIGAYTTKFGELWDTSPRALAGEAFRGALKDAGKSQSDIQALFVANMLSGMLGSQEHLGALFAEELGLMGVPAYKVEGACASGGLAVHAAVLSLLSGRYETVAVLGVEKMTDHKPELVSEALAGAGSSEERMAGITFPGLYAMLARSHMEAYKTTEEEMASVAVKNHHHAGLNPKAQFHNELTIEQVMKSSCVADPLKLLDCSPISDGASVLILQKSAIPASPTGRRNPQSAIQIIASQVATDTLSLAHRSSLVELRAAHQAGENAYKEAGIAPKDIDIAEVHDCFTIAEILAMEDLGFYEKGKAGRAIMQGETTLETAKRVVVNPSGGLKGCGHPVGATGVKQLVELAEQLHGSAGKRQVKNAHTGLAHNVGGSGATCVVHILKTQ